MAGLVYMLGLSYQGLPLDAIISIHDWTGLIMIAFAIYRSGRKTHAWLSYNV